MPIWPFRRLIGVGGYAALLRNDAFRDGLETSLVLGAVVTILTVVIGTAAAFAIARFRFPGAGALLGFFTAPLLLPTIVLGLALLLVFAQLGLLATFTGLVIGHAVVAIPYVIRLMLTAIRNVSPTLEEAAATLGASPLRVFWRVTLPLMRPALLAAAALAFLGLVRRGDGHAVPGRSPADHLADRSVSVLYKTMPIRRSRLCRCC